VLQPGKREEKELVELEHKQFENQPMVIGQRALAKGMC